MAANQYTIIQTGVPTSTRNTDGLSKAFAEEVQLAGYLGRPYITNCCFFWSVLGCLVQSLVQEIDFLTDEGKHLLVLKLIEISGFKRFNELVDTVIDDDAIQQLANFLGIRIKIIPNNPERIVKIDNYVFIRSDAPYHIINQEEDTYPMIQIWHESNHYSSLKEQNTQIPLTSDGSNLIRVFCQQIASFDLIELPEEMNANYIDKETQNAINQAATSIDDNSNQEIDSFYLINRVQEEEANDAASRRLIEQLTQANEPTAQDTDEEMLRLIAQIPHFNEPSPIIEDLYEETQQLIAQLTQNDVPIIEEPDEGTRQLIHQLNLTDYFGRQVVPIVEDPDEATMRLIEQLQRDDLFAQQPINPIIEDPDDIQNFTIPFWQEF